MNSIRKCIFTSTLALTSVGVIYFGFQNNSLNKANNELIEVISEHKENINSISLDFKELQDKYYTQKNKYNSLEEEKDELQKEYTALQTELDELQKKYDKSITENEELKDTLARQSKITLTASELDLLERLVYCEVGNESPEAQIAVTNVIINRIKSVEFPDTLREVIYQENQFSPVDDGSLDKCEAASEEVKESVQRALKGVEAVSNDTLYFFATWVRSNHPIRNHVTITKTIGKTHFGK